MWRNRWHIWAGSLLSAAALTGCQSNRNQVRSDGIPTGGGSPTVKSQGWNQTNNNLTRVGADGDKSPYSTNTISKDRSYQSGTNTGWERETAGTGSGFKGSDSDVTKKKDILPPDEPVKTIGVGETSKSAGGANVDTGLPIQPVKTSGTSSKTDSTGDLDMPPEPVKVKDNGPGATYSGTGDKDEPPPPSNLGISSKAEPQGPALSGPGSTTSKSSPAPMKTYDEIPVGDVKKAPSSPSVHKTQYPSDSAPPDIVPDK